MNKLILIGILLFSLPCFADTPPYRIYTYTDGEIIEADEVTANEDAIFDYLQAGVDTYADDSIVSADILDGTVDISTDTNLTAGTNITLTDDDLNVDDAFLINDANDTTTGSLTMVNCTASSTVTAAVVDTQYIEYSSGGPVILRDVLQLQNLSGVPSSPTNGMIWMESDGLHIYYNGAEKKVTDGSP